MISIEYNINQVGYNSSSVKFSLQLPHFLIFMALRISCTYARKVYPIIQFIIDLTRTYFNSLFHHILQKLSAVVVRYIWLSRHKFYFGRKISNPRDIYIKAEVQLNSFRSASAVPQSSKSDLTEVLLLQILPGPPPTAGWFILYEDGLIYVR